MTARCEELYSKLVESTARKEKATENLTEANTKVESLVTENEELHSYVKKLGGNADFGNNGKTLSEVGERHQRRKLKELKANVEKALWFTETFGLSLSYFLRKG